MKIFYLVLQIFFYFIVLDVFIFRGIFNIGYPSYFSAEDYYIKAPYVGHVSKKVAESYPNSLIFNEENSMFKNLNKHDLKVAFFAGSTGILGEPNLASEIEKSLSEKLKVSCFVANFSILSGNSRQHMHYLLEYLDEFNPDIIIFYNGFNEIVQGACREDPRLLYPYNFYYEEMPEWKKCLVKYSAVFGLLENHYSLFTKYENINAHVKYGSDEYSKKLIDIYFDTFEKSKKISNFLNSDKFTHPVFIGFFQPFLNEWGDLNLSSKIREKIPEYDYIYDVHDEYNKFSKEIWDDDIHVHGEAHVHMGKTIADVIYKELKSKNLLTKLQKQL